MEHDETPEDVFARIVGLHMVEAHLAYMPSPPGESVENH